jgi:DNA repair exonuclease SbcCD ATPase subunit
MDRLTEAREAASELERLQRAAQDLPRLEAEAAAQHRQREREWTRQQATAGLEAAIVRAKEAQRAVPAAVEEAVASVERLRDALGAVIRELDEAYRHVARINEADYGEALEEAKAEEVRRGRDPSGSGLAYSVAARFSEGRVRALLDSAGAPVLLEGCPRDALREQLAILALGGIQETDRTTMARHPRR